MDKIAGSKIAICLHKTYGRSVNLEKKMVNLKYLQNIMIVMSVGKRSINHCLVGRSYLCLQFPKYRKKNFQNVLSFVKDYIVTGVPADGSSESSTHQWYSEL